MPPIKSVRGVRDILPADLPLWNAAEDAGAQVARRFGYEEIRTPLLEHSELIERVGEDTDAVAKELYRFDDRGGRNLALRPEATAGVVRAYFEGLLNQGPQPSRLYLFGAMFRYDRPQKGRYRHTPYLVRGLDYYTRTVFEFYPGGATGQQDALASGGRYDGLAEAEGWPSTPGVGFAGGLDRVTELMAAKRGEAPLRPPADVLVLPDGDLAVEASEVARTCRLARSVAVDYEPKSLRAKMRSANKLGARWVVLLSAEDAARRVAQLREMTTGEQTEVPWDELPARITSA